MSYLFDAWGDLYYPIPSYISHISVFNLSRSVLVILGESIALFIILCPINLFKLRKMATISLISYLFFCHLLGRALSSYTETASFILTGIVYFLLLFVKALVPHWDIILSSYIFSYLLSITYGIPGFLESFMLFLEFVIAGYFLIFLEIKYIQKGKKDISIQERLKITNLSDLIHRSLHISFSLTVLFCQLNIYNFFEDGHTINPSFSIFHLLVPMLSSVLWPIVLAYNGFFLNEPDLDKELE